MITIICYSTVAVRVIHLYHLEAGVANSILDCKCAFFGFLFCTRKKFLVCCIFHPSRCVVYDFLVLYLFHRFPKQFASSLHFIPCKNVKDGFQEPRIVNMITKIYLFSYLDFVRIGPLILMAWSSQYTTDPLCFNEFKIPPNFGRHFV